LKRGTLLIISAPSGAGKTTILQKIMATVSGLAFSVSHTTRGPRPGETNGVDYHFISHKTFQKMRDDNAFLEWAEVHGNFYGTSRHEVDRLLDQGKDVILDIDVQGAMQVRNNAGIPSVSLFIMPPSLAELEKRLRGRATDAEDTIRLRLNNARREMREADQYDHMIVNDTVEDAVDMVRAVILAERSRKRRSAAGAPLSLFM